MNRVTKLLGFSREYMNRMKVAAKKFGYLICKPIVVRGTDGHPRRLNDEIRCLVGFRLRKSEKKCSISIGEDVMGNSEPVTVTFPFNGDWYSFVKGKTSKKPDGASWRSLHTRALLTVPKRFR